MRLGARAPILAALAGEAPGVPQPRSASDEAKAGRSRRKTGRITERIGNWGQIGVTPVRDPCPKIQHSKILCCGRISEAPEPRVQEFSIFFSFFLRSVYSLLLRCTLFQQVQSCAGKNYAFS
jgi:hypothetical protein